MSKKAHETALPKRRFPEFRDAEAWEIPALGELMDGVSKRNRDNKISRVFTNSAVSGIIDQRDFFDKDIATAGNTDNYTVIELGDYVYNPRISEFAPVGPTSRNKLGQGIVSPLYTVFRFRNSNHNEFYDYYFGSTHWQNSLKAIGNSGARHDRMGISLTQLRLVKVPYPSLAEQQKIAAALASLDALLTAQTAKLTTLQAYKRGLMQDLFPAEGEMVPKRRFPEFQDAGKWEEKKLGDIVRFGSGGTPSKEKAEFWNGNIPWISASSMHGTTLDRSDLNITEAAKKAGAAVVGEGVLLLLVRGSILHRRIPIGITTREVAFNQDVKSLLIKKGLTSLYLLYYLVSVEIILLGKVTATGIGAGKLDTDDLRQFPICIPSPAEQQKIADCLTSLDNLITAQSKKLEALKLHKKGLMQALFPAASEPAT